MPETASLKFELMASKAFALLSLFLLFGTCVAEPTAFQGCVWAGA